MKTSVLLHESLIAQMAPIHTGVITVNAHGLLGIWWLMRVHEHRQLAVSMSD